MSQSDKPKVFISSTIVELRDVRAIIGDVLRKRGIDVFVYEKSAGARPEAVPATSLKEVEKADAYIGLFWQKYGEVTVQEYRHARILGKPCLVYIRDRCARRESALEDFLRDEVYSLQQGVTYDYFDNALEVGEQIADDIIAWLVRRKHELETGTRLLGSQAGVDWDKLRLEYLKAVCEHYRVLNLRGLAPRLLEGPPDLPLAQIYIELQFEEGLRPLKEFKMHDKLQRPSDRAEQWPVSKEVLMGSGLSREEEEVEYEPVKQERISEEKTATRLVSPWDAVTRGRTVILGQPGAGKSTTIRYIAIALAGEPGTFVDKRVVGRLPIVARVAKYARRSETEPGLRLAEYLCDQFKPEFTPLLKRELEEGHCMVLLDGLDEVTNVPAISERIEEFAAIYGHNCIVVTSREYAFRSAPIGAGFKCVTLNPMGPDQVDRFIDQWYEARGAPQMREEGAKEATGAARLKEALEAHPKLKELAKNPLMLTIIVMTHWRAAELPSSTIEVYQNATDTLIRHWPLGQDRAGMNELRLNSVRRILMPIAYRMLSGNGLIGEDELLARLTEGIVRMNRLDEARAWEQGIRWLDLISTQSGLLVDQGLDRQGKRVFSFLHQRFAEYLAAYYLSECWDRGDVDFVLEHIHKPQWIEVVVLFSAQAGLGRTEIANKVFQRILNLHSPWEETVWRDHLLVGRCLGEDTLVDGEVRDETLENQIALLTNKQLRLRAKAIEVFAGLRGTQYQKPMTDRLLDLTRKEWPWNIKLAITEALFRLGEREQSRGMLVALRETSKQRGNNDDMAWAIEALLDGWTEETLNWLVDIARMYEGRGLLVEIDTDPSKTAVAAADESFGPIHVGKYLTKMELQTLINQLMGVLTDQEQLERAKWVSCQLEESASSIRELAIKAHNQRVRRLTGEWLAEPEHGEREIGVQVLAELAEQEDGNLLAVNALIRLEEQGHANCGTQTTLTKTLDSNDELESVRLLTRLGQESEATTASVELLCQDLGAAQSQSVAEALLSGTAREVGLAALKVIANSTRHAYRYEAALALGNADELDIAFDVLLDIAKRRGALDRVNALVALNDSRYDAKIRQDRLDLRWLAGNVVNQVNDKYSAIFALLEAGIVPNVISEAEAALGCRPEVERPDWEKRAGAAKDFFHQAVERWLRSLSARDHSRPYPQAAMGYILVERKQTDDAIDLLQKVIEHPEASARLLLRVGERLLKLKAKEAGLKALDRVPAQAANHSQGGLNLAWTLYLNDEEELALKATREIAAEVTEFGARREVAWLLCLLGQADVAKGVLFRGIEKEVPKRREWLQLVDASGFENIFLDIATYAANLDTQFVYALTTKAEMLRRLGQHKEALELIENAIRIDNQYLWAWGVKGQTLAGMGRRDLAIAALDRATELGPDYRWAWTFKANMHREIGQYDNALASAEQATALDESYSWDWAVKGETLENIGQRVKAVEALERAIELDADWAWPHVLKAETLRRLGRYDEGLEAVEQALRLDGSDALAWRVKSETLDGLGRYDEARAILLEALNCEDRAKRLSAIWALAEVGDPQVVTSLSKVLTDAESDVRKTAAWALGTLGDSRATESLAKALTDSDVEVREQAASALSDLGDVKAKDDLIRALDDTESIVRGRAAEALGQIADEPVFKRLGNMILEDEEGVAERIASGLAYSDSETALDILQHAIANRPHIAMLHSRLGVFLRRQGRLDEAIAAHDQAVQREQYRSVLYSSRGLTYLAKTQYEIAASDFRLAIVLNPDWGGPWAGLACAQFEMGHFDEATGAWWRAKSGEPGTAYVLAELAIGLWVTGTRNEALRLWRRAVARESELRDWAKIRRDQGWGPRMIEIAQEIAATLHDQG